MRWKTHGKFIIAAGTAVLMAAYATYRDAVEGGMTPSEWVTVVIAGFTALQVWWAANITGSQHAKTVFMAIGVALNLLVSYIVGGLSSDEIVLLVVNLVGALGVSGAPAVQHLTSPRRTTLR